MKVAYTYHQPKPTEPTDPDSDQSNDSEETSPLLELNDDCLFAVFNLCDNKSLVNLSETCARFNTLLSGSYNFPNNKEFSVYNYVDRCGHLMPLAFIRKILRLMGSYFRTLHLEFFQLDDDQTLRCLEAIVKHCQTNTLIHRLELYIDKWHNEYNALIEPIVKNLQTLDVHISNWKQHVVTLPDFPALCPHLRKIVTDILLENCSTATRPNLQSYSFDSYSDDLINTPNMLEFFANNPQITTFKCGYLRSHDLPSIAVHLPNIQKLSLVVNEISSSNDFVSLKSFKHLTKLKLSFVRPGFREMPEIDLRQTIQCFRAFSGLLELKLYFTEKNNQPAHIIQRSIIALSKMLPNLERFDLVGLKLVQSTVVDFVRFAAKLKSLHLHVCDVYATESLITKLVCLSIRKSRQVKLKLFLDDDDHNDAVAAHSTDIQQYLIVEWDCAHNLRWVN